MRAVFSRLKFLASGVAGALGGCVGSSQGLTAPRPGATGLLGSGASQPQMVASIAAVQLQIGGQLYVVASVPGRSIPQPTVVTDTSKLSVTVQQWDASSWEVILSATAPGSPTVRIESPGIATAAFAVAIAPSS